MINALTIDVEDYYQVSAFESVVDRSKWDHYESRVEKNTHHLLKILEIFQVKATFFVLGWVAERHPKLVQAIHQKGHEIASHGYSHRRIYTQTPEVFREETRQSKQILEDLIGEAVIGYRAASYSITNKSLWALDILIEEGFSYDSSIFPVWHDLYGIPNSNRFPYIIKRDVGSIQEYPLSTIKLFGLTAPFGGGGYLRLFPPFVTKWAMRRMNHHEKQISIVYLHPWEVDPAQPRIAGSARSKFRHYVNLAKMESTLKSLLRDFQFAPMRELNSSEFEHKSKKNVHELA